MRNATPGQQPFADDTADADNTAASPLATLTKRQLEVLALMAKGHNNAAIARRLVLEEKSVENHINGIFTQLRLRRDPAAHRRVKAVLLYLEERGGAPPARNAA